MEGSEGLEGPLGLRPTFPLAPSPLCKVPEKSFSNFESPLEKEDALPVE